ncbi:MULTISPECIES: L-threonylcarbamoyladenylate synthase [Microbacterium]|jgi:tRNA threonylcarbamoyl adenosine modification protein (Sua5/YciO/YrdC/YwlC family)|uniref:L-threonylcarbamoyladenylate synthase n=1 Tax=Microbacterium testaceum TaxID=2033 RepID=A0A147F676_MICTE|nr:L-threonylcarbamoyladenylate synthase [Microbacterium testaceum]KTS03122.1 translation factor SUA5 [Microbacterium testaceum]KTS09694.1 translation factor SUA5 [Microbacterium testaceum]KTS55834.1 translation factor SUA5 [Microbacterium testaceum]KTS91981.1 translation factor SUA5 [Microbacterium testaceum]
MSPVYDCRDESQLLSGMRHARQAIGRGELVVLPTDTVYGVAADAFNARAVAGLLEAKGRGRQQPPPVLVAGIGTLRALVAEIPPAVDDLVREFWPGGLTIVLPAQPSLSWDLGDTHGTVAVRMPAHHLTLELLEETGPLAVSSANRTGMAAAVNIDAARDMLGDSVAAYLDSGPSETGIASTIVDATTLVGGAEPRVRVLREGAVSRERLREVLGDLLEPDPDPDAPVPTPAAASADASSVDASDGASARAASDTDAEAPGP